jgi:hypothetical protein
VSRNFLGILAQEEKNKLRNFLFLSLRRELNFSQSYPTFHFTGSFKIKIRLIGVCENRQLQQIAILSYDTPTCTAYQNCGRLSQTPSSQGHVVRLSSFP